MASKHRYFLDQIGMCETSRIVDLDKRIPGSRLSLRKIILNLKDNSDGHRVFNSIDVKWNNPSIFVMTFRPDKTSLAYDHCNNHSTNITHLYPDTDLSHVLTLEGIQKAFEEIYHPDPQTFTTMEDIAIDREITDDNDDDSLNFLDLSGMEHFDDKEDTKQQPLANTRVFNFTGDADTVSTIATDTVSVTFIQDDDDEYFDNDADNTVTQTNNTTTPSTSATTQDDSGNPTREELNTKVLVLRS